MIPTEQTTQHRRLVNALPASALAKSLLPEGQTRFALFSAGSGGREEGRRHPSRRVGGGGQDPPCPQTCPTPRGEQGLAASPPDSPAHVRTPRWRSSPSGLQTSCLSQNGTPELSPGRGKTRAEWLQQPFCAVLRLSQPIRQAPCLTLFLPSVPELLSSQIGD